MRAFEVTTSWLSSSARLSLGMWVHPELGPRPDKRLILYEFEASPYCRLAREALCELEIPYVIHNVGKKSPSRPAFLERSGRMMVPWLHDPNTDTSLFESADIVRYVQGTYGA